MVEDDAVAASDFLRRINAALQQLDSWRARWLYLKLWCATDTQEVMADPVVCTGDGQSYEKAAIRQWLDAHDSSPVTGQPLAVRDLIPNYALRSLIRAASTRPAQPK